MSHLSQRRDDPARSGPAGNRRAWHGVANTVRFNWDYYLFALGIIVTCSALAILPVPGWVRGIALTGTVVACYFMVASLLASLWIYDLAPLYRWEWLLDFIGREPRKALNIHVGFDESSLKLRELLPRTEWTVAEFFDPTLHNEASIARARKAYATPLPYAKVASAHLPFASHSFDTVCLLFAAHEMRSATEREMFFQELHRVVSPNATVVLVEHVRNLANLAVYGPGALHFYPEAEWQRLAGLAGFSFATPVYQTPFVAVFKLTA